MLRILRAVSQAVALAAVLGLCVLSAAAYTFVVEGEPDTPSTPKELDCGQIQGSIGGLPTWEKDSGSETAYTWQRSWGDYGGTWNGSQFLMVELKNGVQTDTLKHEYAKSTNSSPSHKYAYVRMDATPSLSGSSTIQDPSSPGWWWNCACVAQAQRPVVKYRVGADWIQPALDTDNDPSNDVGKVSGGTFDAQDVVDSEPAAPAQGYPVPGGVPHYPPNTWRDTGNPTTNPGPTNYPESTTGYVGDAPGQPPRIHDEPKGRGAFRGSSTAPIPLAAELVEISLQLDVNASVTSDNAVVSNWRVVIEVDFQSKMSQNKINPN